MKDSRSRNQDEYCIFSFSQPLSQSELHLVNTTATSYLRHAAILREKQLLVFFFLFFFNSITLDPYRHTTPKPQQMWSNLVLILQIFSQTPRCIET